MLQTVVSIVEGFTNTQHWPYAYAELTCGHDGALAMKPSRGKCLKCEAAHDLKKDGSTRCSCGSIAFAIIYSPHPHKADDRVTAIGESFECEACDREVIAVAEMRAALLSGEIVHTRFRGFGADGYVTAYRRDSSSPSGVFMAASLNAKAFDKLFAELRGDVSSSLSPLSPTEGLAR